MYGINANEAGLLTTHTYDRDHPGSGYRIPSKHVGLHLSHVMAWTTLWHLGVGYGLVLEDDALFEDGWFPRYQQALRDVPDDMDILHLGSCNTGDKVKTQVAGEVWEVKYPQCTHSYVVARKALPVLLATQQKIWAPIDLALIFNSYPQLKVYTVLPRICDQHGQDIAP